jgi:hypothetical protein
MRWTRDDTSGPLRVPPRQNFRRARGGHVTHVTIPRRRSAGYKTAAGTGGSKRGRIKAGAAGGPAKVNRQNVCETTAGPAKSRGPPEAAGALTD